MKGIILTDLDMTVIGKNYGLTIDREIFQEAVEKVKRRGFEIGLCSDTPHERLLEFAQDFAFDGPIIAEKGAFSVWHGNKKIFIGRPALPIYQEKTWQDNKEAVQFRLQGLFPNSLVFVEDYRKVFNSLDKKSFLENGKNFFVIDPFRRYSFGLQVRTVGNGKPIINPDVFNEACQAVKKDFCHLENDGICYDFNVDYGVCLVCPEGIEKDLAVRGLRAREPLFPLLVYIGDGKSDALVRPHVDILMSVGNAVKELKEKSDYIASGTVSEGFVECLNEISSAY